MFGASDIWAKVMVKSTSAAGTVNDTEYQRIVFPEHFSSQNIGPFVVPHPDLGGTLSIRIDMADETVHQDFYISEQNATQVQWTHLNALEVGTG
jgi:hypothetical protein